MVKLQRIDACGLRCPHPVLVLGNQTAATPPGTIVEVTADCPTFERDVRSFCERRGKTVLAVRGTPPKLTIQIQY
ncbi:MAG TPA: sulfurtransferase TusA family protein [Anaeromyxobacteraceae bacterium]|nr:sulfurtransferase TusA family protein [Anaeromyxobacteraceae bacterium]